MKSEVTERAAQRSLQRLIDFCAKNRGAYGWVQIAFERRTKKAWGLRSIYRWLNPDPKKRIEPRYGAGLVLVKVGKMVIEKKKQEADKFLLL